MSERTASDQEAEMLRRLVAHDEDAEGLLAFAIHRRTVHDWVNAYQARENRSPDAAALSAFMLGETTERRLREYRERANLMLAMPPETAGTEDTKKNIASRKMLRTWFWPWGIPSAFAVDNPDQPINWKGLFARLSLLMLAVIVTALLLRYLVVRNI